MPLQKEEFLIKIEKLFNILSTGNPAEIKDAKKSIEKLWKDDRSNFKLSIKLVEQIINSFDSIKNPINQAAVISGMWLFYLILADDHFILLKDFILKNLQHLDGRVREAARKTGDWLYISLTSRTGPFSFGIKKGNKERREIANKQYLDLVIELERLINIYDDEKETGFVEYIDDMKPSINKSLQMFWSRFTDNIMYSRIKEVYHLIPNELLLKKQDIERELSELLEQLGSTHKLQDIKDIIYNEESQDDLVKVTTMFDFRKGQIDMIGILNLINDAWNYFPHRSLGGLCPMEKVLEYQGKQG